MPVSPESSLEVYQQQLAKLTLHQSNEFLSLLDGSVPVDTGKGAAVYAANRRGALFSAMGAAFPVCQWLVGNDYFSQLVKSWLGAEPVIAGDMNTIGQSFSSHLAELCEVRPELESLRYLPDVAALEWCYQQSYYADARCYFDGEAFAALNSDELDSTVLVLNPGTMVLPCEWSVHQLRQAFAEGAQPQVSLSQNWLLICRPTLVPEMVVIEGSEAAFLQAVEQGICFGELLVAHPESMSRLGEYIQRGIIGGWR